MNNLYLKLRAKCQNMISSEEGQDLVEYALIIALVSVALVAGLGTLATSIGTAFTNIEGSLK